MSSSPTRALVLSGGGARGAYEVGVISHIFTHVAKSLGHTPRPDFVCGTSVGAVHACFIASSLHLPNCGVSRLENVWRNLSLASLLKLSPWDLIKLPKDVVDMLSGASPDAGVLLDVPAFKRIVTQDIAWPQIRRNIAAGLLRGLTVSTTHIQSGRTVVFVDQNGDAAPSWTRDARRRVQAARIGPQHALASAAIPLLFTPVSLDGAYYCDGGLRQNTPLSPALRLGADKVLVIAVGHGQKDMRSPAQLNAEAAPESPPGAALVAGKVLNALLLDHLDYDLQQMRGFNRLLEDGIAAYGPDFLATLGSSTQATRGAAYRPVQDFVIRPSRDLGEVAYSWMQRHGPGAPGVLGRLLRAVGQAESDSYSADFLSYLSFDGSLAAELIALGQADGEAHHDALVEFFRDS